MKKILLNLIYFLWVVLGIGIIVYNLFFSDHPDYQRVAKTATIFVVIFVTFVGSMRRQKNSAKQVNEKAYKDLIRDAFQENKDAYDKLMKGMEYYNCDRQMKGAAVLTDLLGECTTANEYFVVHFFRALCMSEADLHEDAIEIYQKALEYDSDNSTAWSNLGIEYLSVGKSKKAEESFLNAVMYDAHNGAAYTNLSVLYLRTGETERAADNAMQALRVDSGQTEAMSSAAIAYKMLGDERNADKYRKMYIANGGDKKELQEMLEDLEG